jgi:hypothetical protein
MFENNKTNVKNLSELVCHSGGASGADTHWEELTDLNGGKAYAYSYKTTYHNSKNVIEISEKDYEEGILEVRKANKYLKRGNINPYMHLLSRNWQQTKNSNHIIAVSSILQKIESPIIKGGTGYAIMMAFIHNKPITVFDQFENKCYEWSYITNVFHEKDVKDIYIIDKNFTGIGSRALTENGKQFINAVFENMKSII